MASSKSIPIPISGDEARALDAAAIWLTTDTEAPPADRKRVAEQLLRLNARFKIRDKDYRG